MCLVVILCDANTKFISNVRATSIEVNLMMPQMSIFNDLIMLAKCWHSACLLDGNIPLILVPHIRSLLVLL